MIHNKFVVVDFNGDNPVVFTGSSNLAKGGEEQNGDSLLAIYDPAVAIGYAVEGIRLVDHYHFRMMQSQHPSSSPITLQGAGSGAQATKWWEPYYDKNNNKYNERVLFSQGHQALVKAQAAAAGSGAVVQVPITPATAAQKPKPIHQPPAAVHAIEAQGQKKRGTGKKSRSSSKAPGGKKAGSKKKAGTSRKAATKSRTAARKASGRKRAASKKKSPKKPAKRAATKRRRSES